MARRVRGVLTVEDEQTGDGRVIAPGVTTWVDPPLPLAWLLEEQHGDLLPGGRQVGTIQTITRAGNEISFTGEVDDEQPDGAEVIRRLTAGTATHGDRFGVSIDPDNWAVEIIATDMEEDEGIVILAAAGEGALPAPGALIASARTITAAGAALVAEAGDPDPGDDGGDGVILFSDDSGSIIERYTRLRIRGATICAVPAFAGAYLELDDEAVPAPAPEAEPEAVTAGAPAAVPLIRGLFPVNPPSEMFREHNMEPDGSLNLVDKGSEAGWAHGYIACWNTCHTGYSDRCVPPPRELDYTPFHVGQTELENGDMIATGVFAWGIPHAGLDASMIAAQDHYGHSDAMFARVVAGPNDYGIWFSGALRPSLTRDDVADLRALSMSGDWRWSAQSRSLRLIAALAVLFPGFTVPRRSAMAAAARVQTLTTAAPQIHMAEDGRITAMTSAGVLLPASASGHESCGCGGSGALHDPQLAEIANTVRKLELRTRHLIPDAAAYVAGRR